jgi:hypothetical protein
MSRAHTFAFSIAAASLIAFGANSALADDQESSAGAVRLVASIPIPASANKMYVFDISWVDAATQRYYLADRSNAAVDVVDAKTGTFIKQIHGGFKGFTGSNDTSGPNGVTVAGHFLFVTDAPSRVVSIDLRTDAVINAVSTGGATGLRADELAYDPADGLLLVVNNADSPPFASLIKVDKQSGHLTAGTAECGAPPCRITLANATNGAEQPVWDAATGRFYLSIPEVNGNGGSSPHGAVARINPNGNVETTYAVDFCQPAGLALGPRQNLLLGCSVIFDTAGQAWSASDANTAAPIQVLMDARTGDVLKMVAGVGGSDEVWFNDGDGRYYTASRAQPGGPVLGVIDASSKTLVQVVPTINVAAVAGVHPAGTAHSVAVNPVNNHAFVPLPANNVFPNCLNGCIAVFAAPGNGKGNDDDNSQGDN